ncbi:MAG: protein-arginine deiminase domain-containing protein [Candidatus Moduliflexus flocculans]|nr:protein-arginine deiminase domain-containing protein [Candidatus Moduliflexus flocculans]
MRRGPVPALLLRRPGRGGPGRQDEGDGGVRSQPRAARRVGRSPPRGRRRRVHPGTRYLDAGCRGDRLCDRRRTRDARRPSRQPRPGARRRHRQAKAGPGLRRHQEGDFRGRQAEWIDWYGNLEVSPPVTSNGREFENGRFYAGTQTERAMHPEVIEFLEAQAAQGPVLWLDTSWLVIGHVDETVSWVPSKVGTPFRMMIPSPRLAVEILKKAEQDAPGGILNRGTKRNGDKPGEFERPVAAALRDKGLMAAQEYVQGKIDAVRRTLQAELGVADADIIEIPVLFNSDSRWFPGRYFSETVNMVNGLLLGNDYIVPDPRGPLVDGKDVLLQAVMDRLEPIGCRVVPLDCFDPYHRGGGEIHCGTNAARRKPKS